MRTPPSVYDDVQFKNVLGTAPYGTVCTIRPDGSVDVEVGNTDQDPAVALANLLNKKQQECTEPDTMSTRKVSINPDSGRKYAINPTQQKYTINPK